MFQIPFDFLVLRLSLTEPRRYIDLLDNLLLSLTMFTFDKPGQDA